MSGMPEFESVEEYLAWQREQHDRHDLSLEAFSAAWRSLITEELSIEQLETVGTMLTIIVNADEPLSIANYYQGQISGVHLMRKPTTLDASTLKHEFVNSDDLDNPYCGACNLPPANAVHQSRETQR